MLIDAASSRLDVRVFTPDSLSLVTGTSFAAPGFENASFSTSVTVFFRFWGGPSLAAALDGVSSEWGCWVCICFSLLSVSAGSDCTACLGGVGGVLVVRSCFASSAFSFISDRGTDVFSCVAPGSPTCASGASVWSRSSSSLISMNLLAKCGSIFLRFILFLFASRFVPSMRTWYVLFVWSALWIVPVVVHLPMSFPRMLWQNTGSPTLSGVCCFVCSAHLSFSFRYFAA